MASFADRIARSFGLVKRAARDWEGMPGKPGGPSDPVVSAAEDAKPVQVHPPPRIDEFGLLPGEADRMNSILAASAANVKPENHWLARQGAGAFNTLRTIGEDAVYGARGLGNGLVNFIWGRGWYPSDGMFGSTVHPRGLYVKGPDGAPVMDNTPVDKGARGIDHAKALTVGAADRVPRDIVNGAYKVFDVAAGALGAEPVAPIVERANEAAHARLRDRLYTDPTRPELEVLENTGEYAGEIGLNAALGGIPGAARVLPTAINGLIEAGSVPSYGVDRDRDTPLRDAVFWPSLFGRMPEAAMKTFDAALYGGAVGSMGNMRASQSMLDYIDSVRPDVEAYEKLKDYRNARKNLEHDKILDWVNGYDGKDPWMKHLQDVYANEDYRFTAEDRDTLSRLRRDAGLDSYVSQHFPQTTSSTVWLDPSFDEYFSEGYNPHGPSNIGEYYDDVLDTRQQALKDALQHGVMFPMMAPAFSRAAEGLLGKF